MDTLDALLRAWDEMDNAAADMCISLPAAMTTAAERLEAARRRMREAVRVHAMATWPAAPATKS